MINDYPLTIQKTPSISNPFRHKLFRPSESLIFNPISHKDFTDPNSIPIQEPIYNEDGEEVFKLSDVIKEIDQDIKKQDEKIREKYIKEIRDEILKNVKKEKDNENKETNKGIKNDDLSVDTPQENDDVSNYIYY